MKLFRKIVWWVKDRDIDTVVIFLAYALFVVYAGYSIGGAIKEWARTHIIVIKEIQ